MNASLYPLTHGKYSQGEYTVAAGLKKDELIEWIKRGEFRNFERGQFIISKKGHHYNAVYGFFLPSYPAKLAMKRSMVNSRFHFLRIKKIRAWYYHWSGIYASRAFFGSCLFFDKGIQVARPLACWTFRHGWKKWFMTDNYFLYEYQHGETIRSIIKRLKRRGRNEDIHQWHCKIFAFIKLVHLAGLRHRDQHAGNFIVGPSPSSCFSDTELAICLIDNDKAKRARHRHTLVPAVKYFFDFEDLARAQAFPKGSDAIVPLLRVYLGREPTSYDLWLMSFWRGGGIRIKRRFREWIIRLYRKRKRLKK